jgi:hypothetical protein
MAGVRFRAQGGDPTITFFNLHGHANDVPHESL